MKLNLITKSFEHLSVRRAYNISYPQIEFECKMSSTSAEIIELYNSISKNVKNGIIEIDEVVSRKEFHHFCDDKKTHRALIFTLGSKEVWIKEKSDAKIVYSPQYKIPILVRREKKLEPKDSGYDKLFSKTLKSDYIGSFKKECTDISFWFKNFLFTITISESVAGKSIFSQVEIEYDGHHLNIKRPSKKILPSLFDEVICLLLPKLAMHFTVETKLHWLKSERAN